MLLGPDEEIFGLGGVFGWEPLNAQLESGWGGEGFGGQGSGVGFLVA